MRFSHLRRLVCAVLLPCVAGCSYFLPEVDQDLSELELQCYPLIVDLQTKNEQLTEAYERSQRALDAVRNEEYPRFIAAFELYIDKDWPDAVDGFAAFLREFPDSQLAPVALRLLGIARVNAAEEDLFCSEGYRILQSQLEALTGPEREGPAAAFLKECESYEEKVDGLLAQLARADAIRERYTGDPRSGDETLRGESVGLEEEEELTNDELLELERKRRIETDELSVPQ